VDIAKELMIAQLKQPSAVYIRLVPYLQELALIEQTKPNALQRPVPTLAELAKIAGLSRNAMSNLTTGKTRSLNLDLACLIIDEMRRRGFDMELTDLVAYQAGSELLAQELNREKR
jgi:DNA-binding Xre family transcriptional regulator